MTNKVFTAFLFTWLAALLTGLVIVIYVKYIKPIDDIKESVKHELIDPGSAEFRDVRITNVGFGCGEVNAKNTLGGYVGFHHFWVSGLGDEKNVLLDRDTSNIAEELCKEPKK